jgi:hypothetical protein
MNQKNPMADTKKPAASKTKTIIDVAHPGKSAPAGNSKSVIISNRPILKDPMVVDEAPVSVEDVAKSPTDTITKRSGPPPLDVLHEEAKKSTETVELSKSATIAELAAVAAAKKPETSSEEPKPDKPAETEPEDKAEAEPEKPEPKTDDKSEDDESKGDEADKDKTDDDSEEASSSKQDDSKKETAEAVEQAKQRAAIEKLADSKKYYLPINTVEKRRSRRFVVLGVVLSLLLIVAWADIALDAGLIHVSNIKAPTHFFSN